jgi:spore germination cell wall hydrolase CwlJ-like protein
MSRLLATALTAATLGLAGAAAAEPAVITLAVNTQTMTTPAAPAPEADSGVQALIGGGLQPASAPAAVRFGPEEAYADGMADAREIMLPLMRLRPGASGDRRFYDAALRSSDPRTCLAQAVYYEARSEPLGGQEAVAQVVLNRVNDPHYPKSVCGVVYQTNRSGRVCQFTFACDGSMNRAPRSESWSVAQMVAERALAGTLTPAVKDATHYHASWMTPYWSSSLTKLRQVGGHVFYR